MRLGRKLTFDFLMKRERTILFPMNCARTDLSSIKCDFNRPLTLFTTLVLAMLTGVSDGTSARDKVARKMQTVLFSVES